MIPYETLCPGCFKEKNNAGSCEHCRYNETEKRSPLLLPHRTLLDREHYLVGRVLGKPGGFGITYLAQDLRLKSFVAVKEYLPRDLAGRDAGDNTVAPHSREDEEMFRYGLKQFFLVPTLCVGMHTGDLRSLCTLTKNRETRSAICIPTLERGNEGRAAPKTTKKLKNRTPSHETIPRRKNRRPQPVHRPEIRT